MLTLYESELIAQGEKYREALFRIIELSWYKYPLARLQVQDMKKIALFAIYPDTERDVIDAVKTKAEYREGI